MKKKKKVKKLAKKYLTETGFSVIFNKEKKCYNLVTIKYDLGTKQAFVEKIEYLADSAYRAEFEIKKLLAHGFILKN